MHSMHSGMRSLSAIFRLRFLAVPYGVHSRQGNMSRRELPFLPVQKFLLYHLSPSRNYTPPYILLIGCWRRMWLGWASCSLFPTLNQSQPTKKRFLWEKVTQMPLLTYYFLRLGWPWVGEFVGFMIIVTCFPTQQNLVYRKHPIAVPSRQDHPTPSSKYTPPYTTIPSTSRLYSPPKN